ncbi:MAG: VanZ family protein [Clostridia bacterium]|nr:VanZ family protein [Clostridia bacterium]
MTRSRVFAFLAALVTVFIFAASSQNGEQSSGLSSGLLDILMSILGKTGITLTHLFIRKTAHFAEFFMQSLFLSLSAHYSAKGIKHYITSIAFAGLLTACMDEFSQYFSLGRSAQVSDVLIDFSGTVFALILILAIVGLSKRRAQ